MVVLHLPIGFLSIAALLEAWFWWRRVPWARQANTLVLPVAALSAVAAAGLGWLRAGAGEFDPHLLDLHRWSGVGLAAATVLASVLLPRSDRGTPSKRQVLRFHATFGAALFLLGAAGHFGGSLTHGSGFLTRGAPRFVRQLIGETAPVSVSASDPAPKPIATQGAPAAATSESAYRATIQPALQQRCYSCHGPEKQKGKLRLDRRESAMTGGESGEPAIQPGDIRKSRLLYHVLLPREHDDAMPPDGKEPLTPDQILAISRWIQQGAPFE
jgi:mono/diheme cytochrome c family protein